MDATISAEHLKARLGRSVPMLHSYFRVGVPQRYVKPVLAVAQAKRAPCDG